MPAVYPAPRLLATPVITATMAPGFPTQEGDTQEHSWCYSNVKCQRQQCEITGIQNGREQYLNSREHMMSHAAAMAYQADTNDERANQQSLITHYSILEYKRSQGYTDVRVAVLLGGTAVEKG